jgi:hypothetical protein
LDPVTRGAGDAVKSVGHGLDPIGVPVAELAKSLGRALVDGHRSIGHRSHTVRPIGRHRVKGRPVRHVIEGVDRAIGSIGGL